MVITSDNNIGINTTFSGVNTPSLLTIKGKIPDGNQIYIIQENDDRGWRLKAKTDGHFYLQSSYTSSSTDRIKVFYDTGVVQIGGAVSGGGLLQVNGNVNINGVFQINGTTIGGGGGSGVTGSGTTNYVSKWTGSSTLGNSSIYDAGGIIGIGTASPAITSGATTGLNVVSNSYIQMRITSTVSSAGIEFFPLSGDRWEVQAGSDSKWFVYNRTNNAYALNINSSGNVNIGGTTDNGYKLQVNGSASFAFGFLSIYRGSTGANDIFVGNQGTRFYIGGNTYVEGSVTALGGFFDTSDSRLKILVKDYEQPKGIENVAARMYVKNNRKELGYFAQDLQEILPSAVIEGEDGFLTLS
jgi:hypothetical protein